MDALPATLTAIAAVEGKPMLRSTHKRINEDAVAFFDRTLK